MPLAAGDRLGPYEIVAPLGAGGMGEVYRARDSRLQREVALKVLPAAFAQDPERIARFEREAKLLASLNHPRIGALYGLEESEGRRVLVLELVAGESLAERLRRGALPLEDALAIACQVASALEAAHESGVVHRDLKPGNVMLRPDDTIKVLDFGLAKGGATDSTSSDPKLSASPTMTYAATEAGVILGTAAYMSPEQARGRAVDRRSDIWSFGCLLYELLTGRQAFAGETVSDTIAAILKSEPDSSALPPGTPRRVSDLLRRCLRKDPASRLRDAGDARIELEEVIATPEAVDAAPVTAPGRRSPPAALATLGAVTVLALALALWALWRGAGASGAAPIRFAIQAPSGITATNSPEAFAIAPDGGSIAFVATDSTGTNSVWLRKLEALVPERVPGTENAIGVFWSPDGRQLAIFADGKLKKLTLAGGVVRVLCDAPDPRGGAWGRAGTIVFSPNARGPLRAVNADGSEVVDAAVPDSAKGEDNFRYPAFLPDGKHFLCVAMPHPNGQYSVWLGQLGSKERRFVTKSGAAPVWAGSGHLLTVIDDRLVAVGFDPARGALKGKPVDLGDAPLLLAHDGCYAVSASRDGKLLFCTGSLANTELAWLDRSGRRIGSVPLPAGRWETFALSLDGTRVAVGRRLSASETNLWVVDAATGQGGPIGPMSAQATLAWSPDGRSVGYQQDVDGRAEIFLRPADGGPERRLMPTSRSYQNIWAWSPDGKSILYVQPNHGTNWDVMLAPVDGSHAPEALVASPANEFGAGFSPDEHWLLYASDESGRGEVYVRSYPEPGVRRQITTTGFNTVGTASMLDWSADGREVLAGSTEILSYPIQPGPTLGIGSPRRLFSLPSAAICIWATADHQRFLVSLPLATTQPPQLAVEANWPARLKTR